LEIYHGLKIQIEKTTFWVSLIVCRQYRKETFPILDEVGSLFSFFERILIYIMFTAMPVQIALMIG